MPTLADISSPYWSLNIFEEGGIVEGAADIGQCIQLIMGTVKGSVPMDPKFGVDMYSYLDRPANEVRGLIAKSIREQVALYEPRAEVLDITVTQPDYSSLVVTLEWRPAGGKESYTIEQIYGRST